MLKMTSKSLLCQQLDRSLERFVPLREIRPPKKGWIRAIRDALGMSSRQLAGRLDMSQQAVSRIERDEVKGSVTMKTMRTVADAMDCEFVYALIPRSSLEVTVSRQAKRLAANRLERASHTMALEDQALGAEENRTRLDDMVNEIADTLPPELWEMR